MAGQRLGLEPFPSPLSPCRGTRPPGSGPTVTAEIGIVRPAGQPARLQLWMQLADFPAGELRVPAPGPTPRRRDGLWQHTCLECFLAAPDHPAYWEYNLSPSGDWNVYRLEAYRHGLQPVDDLTSLPFEIRRATGGLELELDCPLPRELAAVPSLEWSVTAVVEAADGRLGYWAPRHGPGEPDFHLRSLWTTQPGL